MASNIEVKITADIVDLQAQFSVARAESSALTAELNKLARQAADTGMTDELKAQLDQVAEKMLVAKQKTADLQAQLKEAQGAGTSFGQAVSDVNSILGPFGVALSGAAAIGFGRSALEYAADIEHMADVLGLSTDDLQAFHFAATESGVGVDQADMMIRRFMSNLGAAEAGTGTASKALEKLGLDAKELAGDPAQALTKIAQGLLAIPDPAERARMETELFGRSGLDLNAMLEKLSGGFVKLTQDAQAAGLMLDPETTQAAEHTEIKLHELWDAMLGKGAQAILFTVDHWAGLKDELQAVAALSGEMPEWLTGATGKQDEMPWTDPNRANASAQIDAEAQTTSRMLAIDHDYAQKYEDLKEKEAQAAERKAGRAIKAEQKAHDEFLKMLADEAAQTGSDAQRELDEMQRADVQNTNDYIEEANRRLSEAISHFAREYQAHEITAQEKRDQEVRLTETVRDETLKRLDAEIATLQKGTEIYREEMKKRADLAIQYDKDIQNANDQLTTEETQKWQSAIAPINSAFQQMLSGTRSFAQIGWSLVQTFIMKMIESVENSVIQWAIAEHTKTALTDVGNAERTASNVGAAATSNLADANAMKQGVLGHAGSAAAAVWDDVAQIPVVGPILAPPAAAAAFAAVMAFGNDIPSFEVGAWEIKRNVLANIHEGEMILPAGIASQVRAGALGGGSMGGDTHHWTFAPNIRGVPQMDIMRELYSHEREFQQFIGRLFRNGSLRF